MFQGCFKKVSRVFKSGNYVFKVFKELQASPKIVLGKFQKCLKQVLRVVKGSLKVSP